MTTAYTIGRLAREIGIPVSTIRYYERRGLVPAPERTEGNFRLYSPSAVKRIRFIRAAQGIGFTLSDIKSLLEFRDGETGPCREVQQLIEARLDDIRAHLRQLRHVERELKVSLERCRASETDESCEVIEGLTVASTGSQQEATFSETSQKKRQQ